MNELRKELRESQMAFNQLKNDPNLMNSAFLRKLKERIDFIKGEASMTERKETIELFYWSNGKWSVARTLNEEEWEDFIEQEYYKLEKAK